MHLTTDDVLGLTNDKKRRAVIDAWMDWPIWIDVPEIGLTVRKLDLPGGGAFTASWYAGDDFYPGNGTRNVNTPRFRLIGTNGLLSSGCSSISVLTDYLQDLRRELMEEG